MKFPIIALVLLVLSVTACDKDNFQTKPTVKLKSLNGDYIPLNASLVIDLEVTDKEGDVQDSLIVIKNRLNRRVVTTIRDTIRYKFPVFPKNPRIEVQSTLDYQTMLSAITPPVIPGSNPPQREPDTLVLRLAVRDNAGNTSDTIETPRIIVFRN